MVAATGDSDKSDLAGKLGIEPGMIVQELGWDSDVDDEVRSAIEDRCGEDLLGEDAQEVVDVVLLWWRDGDGDLVDTLMDARSPMTAYNGKRLPPENVIKRRVEITRTPDGGTRMAFLDDAAGPATKDTQPTSLATKTNASRSSVIFPVVERIPMPGGTGGRDK